VKQTLERELKLDAPAGFVLPQFPGEPIVPRRFTSTYFDTEDRRLAAFGVTLRRRVEQRRGLWQLKLPREDARLEIEEPGGTFTPPAGLLKLLPAMLRGAPLGPVVKIRTIRTGVTVHHDGRRVAEVVVDCAEILEGARVLRRLNEIEAELLDGTEVDLKDLEVALRAAGALAGDGRPKAFQALNYSPPTAPALKKSATDIAVIQRAIADQYRLIVSHDPGTRIGDDPEDLHQHRVGIRRLRSFLSAAIEQLDPDWVKSLSTELEWIGDLMNPVRDLDVMIPHLRMDLALLGEQESNRLRPFIEGLVDERARAREAMLAGLDGERYLKLINSLEEATRSIKIRTDQQPLARGASKAFNRLKRATARFEVEQSDEDLHRVRRRAKQARYSAELVKATSGKGAAAYLSKLKDLQDVLGEHQDATVAEARVREHLDEVEDKPSVFALGRLVERQVARKRAARADFPQAWRPVAAAGRKAWS
jgi:CHAD domain-containing protein